MQVVGGITCLTNSNEDMVAIGGADDPNCRPLKFLKPVAILLHQLERDQQGGEGFEGGDIEVVEWGERGGEV